MNISEIRQKALEKLRNNWGYPIAACMLLSIPNSILRGPTQMMSISDNLNNVDPTVAIIPLVIDWVVTIIVLMIVIPPIEFGVIRFFLQFAKGGMESPIDTLQSSLPHFKKVVITSLVAATYTFIWSLLFIIPGIIKSYSYSMILYVLNDDPELSTDEAIRESEKLMQGHKLDLFLLYLSFTGWVIVSILTCFIGFFFLSPYVKLSTAIFYESIKQEKQIYDSYTNSSYTKDCYSTDF